MGILSFEHTIFHLFQDDCDGIIYIHIYIYVVYSYYFGIWMPFFPYWLIIFLNNIRGIPIYINQFFITGIIRVQEESLFIEQYTGITLRVLKPPAISPCCRTRAVCRDRWLLLKAGCAAIATIWWTFVKTSRAVHPDVGNRWELWQLVVLNQGGTTDLTVKNSWLVVWNIFYFPYIGNNNPI